VIGVWLLGIAALAVPLAAYGQYSAKPVRILVGYVAGKWRKVVKAANLKLE